MVGHRRPWLGWTSVLDHILRSQGARLCRSYCLARMATYAYFWENVFLNFWHYLSNLRIVIFLILIDIYFGGGVFISGRMSWKGSEALGGPMCPRDLARLGSISIPRRALPNHTQPATSAIDSVISVAWRLRIRISNSVLQTFERLLYRILCSDRSNGLLFQKSTHRYFPF